MKYLSILFCLSALIISSQTAKADDIYFKNGYLLKNVLVKDTAGAYANVMLANDTRKFLLNTIDHIVKSTFDPTKESVYVETNALKYMLENNPRERIVSQPPPTSRTVFPNLKYLPLSLLFAGLSWDFFEDVSSLNSEIDLFKKMDKAFPDDGYDDVISDLETHRTRKTVLGVVFAAAGIVDIIISFKSIEVDLTSDRMTLSYNF